jgi:hypothetical protein
MGALGSIGAGAGIGMMWWAGVLTIGVGNGDGGLKYTDTCINLERPRETIKKGKFRILVTD